MSEKRDAPVKLNFDFNESRCCEVYFDGLNRYHRVTATEFRSFGGKRRILNVDNPHKVFYEDYNGPVYYLKTNKKVPASRLEPKVMFLGDVDPRKFGTVRSHENHLLD